MAVISNNLVRKVKATLTQLLVSVEEVLELKRGPLNLVGVAWRHQLKVIALLVLGVG